MFNRKEQKRQIKRMQLNHEKHEKCEKGKTRKKQKHESVHDCVPRKHALTCIFTCSFSVLLSCFSWLEMDSFVSLCLCAR